MAMEQEVMVGVDYSGDGGDASLAIEAPEVAGRGL